MSANDWPSQSALQTTIALTYAEFRKVPFPRCGKATWNFSHAIQENGHSKRIRFKMVIFAVYRRSRTLGLTSECVLGPQGVRSSPLEEPMRCVLLRCYHSFFHVSDFLTSYSPLGYLVSIEGSCYDHEVN